MDPDETPSYSASHPDPSYLHMAQWSRSAGSGLKFHRAKACLHQPCDKYFLANSYDLKSKPIAGKPQRRCSLRLRIANSHGSRTMFVRLSYEPYKIAGLRIANSHDSPTYSQNFLATVVRPVRIRTSVKQIRNAARAVAISHGEI